MQPHKTSRINNMNNRFKFRVWHKIRKQYLTNTTDWPFLLTMSGHVCEWDGGCWTNTDYNNYRDKDDEYQEVTYVVQQFTGILDRNNKEIYDGDIIKYHQDGVVGNYLFKDVKYFIADIVWHDCQYHIVNRKFKFPEGEYDTGEPLYNDLRSHIEVIGNIFENPELLKKLE